MKPSAWLGLLGLGALSQGARVPRNYERNDYYVLHLDRSTQPDTVAQRLGLAHEGQLGELKDHHVFRAPKEEVDLVKRELTERRRRKRDLGDHDVLDGVLLSTKQKVRQRLYKRTLPPPPTLFGPLDARANRGADRAAVQYISQVKKDLDISDPIFDEQWHLFNPVQLGHDVNVTALWLEGITGKNTTVAIVDDGLDFHSEDLAPNYFAAGSYDFNDDDPDPLPELAEDRHGTRCAGEVSAARNNACGVGVAYDSKIAGIRILSKPISDSDEADAMIYKSQENQIYSCSWGPPDDGKSMEAPDVLIRRAMLQGIQDGRNKLGSIYVFASGNGAAQGDNCNFDGYTNSIYSITIGAVDRAGKHPYYSEHCSAQLVVTYSSGSGDAIHTTDVGKSDCYAGHGGTSAAAPLAAGIFALVMQVRPDLSWRDFQYLALQTAAHVDDGEAEWQETAIGKKFSHTFGYGKIDSYAMVELAKNWKSVKPQAWYFSPWLHVKQAIPEGKDGLVVSFDITEDMLKEANLARLEHVTVTMNVDHTRRGDLSVDLISPQSVISHIATSRANDEAKAGYVDWTFMSVAHWGETGVGRWTLVVKDNVRNKHTGTFVDWHLKLWGESIDAGKAKLLPMPEENDDADHDVISSTISAPAETTTAPPRPEATRKHTKNPSTHPERPTKAGSQAQGTQHNNGPQSTSPVAQEATETPSSHWVSWLPSFGASKKAQIWIYGAVGLIAAFCVGLGVYFFIARRRRMRNDPRNTYEFQLVDEEEEGDGVNANGSDEKVGLTGSGGKRGKRTRGGELYDAFAGGSDDEDFDHYSDRSGQDTYR